MGLPTFATTNSHSNTKPISEASKNIKKGRGRPLKAIINCRHEERPHYARGMCKSCYGKFGNKTKATCCEHIDEVVYGRGLC